MHNPLLISASTSDTVTKWKHLKLFRSRPRFEKLFACARIQTMPVPVEILRSQPGIRTINYNVRNGVCATTCIDRGTRGITLRIHRAKLDETVTSEGGSLFLHFATGSSSPRISSRAEENRSINHWPCDTYVLLRFGAVSFSFLRT
jgi:hypothetical protein